MAINLAPFSNGYLLQQCNTYQKAKTEEIKINFQ